MRRPSPFRLLPLFLLTYALHAAEPPVDLRCEYLAQPLAVESAAPRLSWRLRDERRGAAQTAWRVIVASTAERAARGEGDLWDSGRVASDLTSQIAFGGRALPARTEAQWRVQVWDERGNVSTWSEPARFRVGLGGESDWTAQWIAQRDTTPLHTRRDTLHLPPARHFRTEFAAAKPVARATLYATALGLYDAHLNGQRVGDAFFQPGWSDYRQRAYYQAHDVTKQIKSGRNALGFFVAEGWYAGYVGYGLLVGYGPERSGRNFYGKTPALRAQLEIEYTDGTREVIGSGPDWRVTSEGPIREADLIMGETHDARREMSGWDRAGFADANWERAIPARDNGPLRAVFFDTRGEREIDLGFQAPPRLQAYAAQPIRVTEELRTRQVTEPKPGVFIFDLGQNFAGIIRLRAHGAAGTSVRLRYGEMLHRDGTLMTENLRRARATDTYILRGDAGGETWSPRFTYHGFRYVEVTGLAGPLPPETITGLVLHNDTPAAGAFECSDPVLTQFARNVQWTQRANFVEVPTDCPQRDERLGWMGDAMAYVRTATYNADVAAFFTKWMDDMAEAQEPFGAFPDYAPYPMSHGNQNGKTFGTAWTDAGVICTWTLWQTYADRRLVERMWPALTRFMDFRRATLSSDGLGTSIGNTWGDWLNVNENTPIEYVDTCYHALDCTLMAEMADALGRPLEAKQYRVRFTRLQTAFAKTWLNPDASLKIATQSAYVLGLQSGLIPENRRAAAAEHLARRIAANDTRMATGFLGTRALLPTLSSHGQHETAVALFQSRRFPSWGYEVENGATTVWERWDSFTREHGFEGQSGKQNAAMNSFSHYAFGAVMEWAYGSLAGITAQEPGFRRILIRPRPPANAPREGTPAITWVRAHHDAVPGRITTAWRIDGNRFELEVTVPPNTRAEVRLPTADAASVTEGGKPIAAVAGLKALTPVDGDARVEVPAGRYHFSAALPLRTAQP